MTTVQLALQDCEYARSLRSLLLRDGGHKVLMVQKPDPAIEGVMVVQAGRLADLTSLVAESERLVVITRKSEDQLTRIWNAGIRHVVFEEDSATTAQLAIIAAELRIANPGRTLSRAEAGQHEPIQDVRRRMQPASPLPRSERFRSSARPRSDSMQDSSRHP